MQVHTMYILIADTLVVSGGVILAGAMIAMQRLLQRLPARSVRSNQRFLLASALLLILAYLGYLLAFWNTPKNWHDLIAPFILFVSACSLWLVYKLSLQPAINFILDQENITDPLMGVYNRRYMERRLTEELARAQRYAVPLSIFFLDIDQLKNINASYGRHIGDQALIHLGKLLLEYLRESDEVARYEQDEILVMAPNTSIQDTQLLAERIRQRVEAQPLLLHARTDEEERIPIRVSIGVTTIQGGFDSLEKLIQRAEVALQQASQAGGNKVVVSESVATEIKVSG